MSGHKPQHPKNEKPKDGKVLDLFASGRPFPNKKNMTSYEERSFFFKTHSIAAPNVQQV
jgi:hypothetical protein